MGQTIYPDDGLNTALREHGLSRAGGIASLGDLPDLIREIAPLWWDYTGAAFGGIEYEGGFMGNARSPLIDGSFLFAAAASTGIKTLRGCFERDYVRRRVFGSEHADLLTVHFFFTTYTFAEAARCPFLDGTAREVPAGTVLSVLRLDNGPIRSTPDTLTMRDVRYNARTRKSIIGNPERVTALCEGWQGAYDATQS